MEIKNARLGTESVRIKLHLLFSLHYYWTFEMQPYKSRMVTELGRVKGKGVISQYVIRH